LVPYTCPYCKASSLYPPGQRGLTHCRSCGSAFALSQMNRTHPNPAVKVLRDIREGWHRARTSRVTIYCGAGLLALLVVWLALSAFGFLPDELRLVNRRFVALSDWKHVEQAVGLVALGAADGEGGITFVQYGTAWAVSNDGFMLTSKHVLTPPEALLHAPLGAWVYLNHERYDAQLVWQDSVADVALLKIDAYIPYRFRIAPTGSVQRLNVPVRVIGFQKMPTEVDSTVRDTPLASTDGTISRLYQDKVGTHWIEHSAPVKAGGSGGPVLLGDRAIGLSCTGDRGYYQALDATAYRDKIFTLVKEYRKGRTQHHD
jgi:hypothetical protein